MLMSKCYLLVSLLFFTCVTNAYAAISDSEQIARTEYPTDTLYKIWLEQQKNKDAITKFYDALTEKHLIELDETDTKLATVTYFAKGNADTDYIMQSGGPDFYGLRFKRFGSTDIYYCVQKIPRDAWFTYGVNEFKINKNNDLPELMQTSAVHIYDGAVIGPDAPLSDLVKNKLGVPRGTLREVTINSKTMAELRRIQVYVPAGYNSKDAHNLVLQFDGQNYAAGDAQRPVWEGWTPLPTILDNLIHQQKIGPTITVFIHNQGNRSGDLISDKMTDFVALEVVAWARENFNISSKPKNIVVSGPSRAGFAAANTAFRHANIIGSVLSQSGSFYYTMQDQENWPVYPEFEGKLVLNYKSSAKRDIQFYLDVGLYDLGLGAVGTNRQLRDVLELKGYQVDYYQYKGGHSHLGWRHTVANGLISLLGKENANKKLQRTSR
jgi:enterochelin esterase family protein